MTINFLAPIHAIVMLFLLLVIGYICGRTGVVDGVASKKLSRLVITVTNPALIIYALIKMEYSAQNLELGFGTFLFGIVFHIILAAFSFLCCLWLKPMDERKITEFTMIFGNVGFIGFPILESMLGDKGLFMGAFFCASFNIVLWTWGLSILARKRKDIPLSPKKVLLNWGTVPCYIGITLFLLKGLLVTVFPEALFTRVFFTYVSPPIMQAFSYVAPMCTPISMFIIGALLAKRTPRQLLTNGKIYYLCAMKLVVFPLLVCGVMRLLGFSPNWIWFATTVAAMPSATVVTMLAELHDVAPEYSAQVVGTTSLLSVLTMPLVFFLAKLIIPEAPLPM